MCPSCAFVQRSREIGPQMGLEILSLNISLSVLFKTENNGNNNKSMRHFIKLQFYFAVVKNFT